MKVMKQPRLVASVICHLCTFRCHTKEHPCDQRSVVSTARSIVSYIALYERLIIVYR